MPKNKYLYTGVIQFIVEGDDAGDALNNAERKSMTGKIGNLEELKTGMVTELPIDQPFINRKPKDTL